MTDAGAWGRGLSLAAAVVVCDQATKQVAIAELSGRDPIEVGLGVQLDLVANTGIAFGFLSGVGAGPMIAITLLAVALLVGWFAVDPKRPGMAAAVGLLVGGAIGNLADRVREGAVIDFVDPPAWPAFNLADVAITAGVILLLVTHLRPAGR